nr:hypothetical protein [Arsenophonus endosymbiont of Aleurodicus floccissimus]
MAKLQQDPSLVVKFAGQSVENAKAAILIIIQAQKTSHLQQQQLKNDIAWQLFGEMTLQQAKWRDTVIQHSSSISLRERRVRLALVSN